MITRIEIDGFKSFHKFAMNVRPFQVFIGPNGVGKTNLFEAIALLANLANEEAIDDALRQCRGEIRELFTTFPDGSRASQMTFALEVLIGLTISDGGKAFKVSANRLRYELTLERRDEAGTERVYVIHEELLPIAEAGDSWIKDQIPKANRKDWVVREKRPPYISTETVKEQTTIYVNQDSPGGGREPIPAGALTHTAISTASLPRYPTAYALRVEMKHWRFLGLHPDKLRQRAVSSPNAELAPDGSNLAAAIEAITHQSETASAEIIRDMTVLIPDLRGITVQHVPEQPELRLEVEMNDGSRFSSGVLSDGTLRLLALIVLKHDARHQGVSLFEEPENGVQPQRLKQIAETLGTLATHFKTDSPTRPLRQMLVNTHSPGLLANVPSDCLFYLGMKGVSTGRETHVLPVRPVLFSDSDEKYYTWEQVRQYLDTDSLNKKREELGL